MFFSAIAFLKFYGADLFLKTKFASLKMYTENVSLLKLLL